MKPESVVQSEIRARAGELGILLWRNNVGACTDQTGRMIRYGLGNDSAQVQRRLKSSDLIGAVSKAGGYTDAAPGVDPSRLPDVGRFLAVECKEEGWKFPASWRGFHCNDVDNGKAPPLHSETAHRLLAQWRFICLVRNAGGLAGFAQSVDDFEAILCGEGDRLER